MGEFFGFGEDLNHFRYNVPSPLSFSVRLSGSEGHSGTVTVGLFVCRWSSFPLNPPADFNEPWFIRGSRRFNNSLSRNPPLEVLRPFVNVVSNATEHGSQRNRSMPILRPEL
jgi:hypothetical protein